MTQRNIEIVVIGGGAAGLAAAIKAKESGAEDVWVLDRNEELGGILPQCIHTGFGLHYFGENLTGPEYITRFIAKAQNLGVTFKLNTMVLEITRDKKILAANDTDGLLTLHAKTIVLAMGCREKTREALLIPGTRPAGIFTAGVAQRLMDIEGYMPGKKIVILGSGDIGLIMARRFAMEGAEVKAVIEMMPYPGGLMRNVVQCLEDFDIPLRLEQTITFIHGRDRIEAVTVSKVDAEGNPIPNTDEKIECDALILSVGLIPENELSEGAGIELDSATGGPIVNEYMETSIPGIFACGNVVTVYDLVDYVTITGEIAGENASKYVFGELPELRSRIILKRGKNVRSIVPQIISGENPVTLYIRVTKPMRNVKVKIGNLVFPKRAVRPPEMLMIDLTHEKLGELEKIPEIMVGIDGEEL
jgi:NADPH-dependent 2,4-dienoyl-CoA reductase/sulfur reductase-like enzyme